MSEWIVVNRETGAYAGPMEGPRARELRDALLDKGLAVTTLLVDPYGPAPDIPKPSSRLVRAG